ncbi:MAG: TetR/AcrR family transcriptional regulator [Mycolicibacter algericus]|uniref:TetR/AcrR family transcriptional regulator n=1 Tax=Mycolicibacter algericus TaxID=1288388 RepID=UPI003C751BEC
MTHGHNGLAARPARGTRPRNRRQLIVEAAAALLTERGYRALAMSDVAEAVAVSPSALYRHFRSKDDLLATVIEEAITDVGAVMSDNDTPAGTAVVLAQAAVSNRSAGVLYRREARHLPAGNRERLRTITRETGGRLAKQLRRQRPELGEAASHLLAWCALGVGNSISYHHLSLPEPEFTNVLAALISVPLQADPSVGSVQIGERTATVRPRSRREAILSAATDLFAGKGFSGVNIDDIGAAVGIAGPSIYNHFAAKTDILAAAIFRGSESLWMDYDRVLSGADSAGAALTGVVSSYQRFAFDHPNTLALLRFELSKLPEPERQRALETQRAYIDEWVHLIRLVDPAATPTESRIRVQACQEMINEVAGSRQLRAMSGAGTAIVGIGADLLQARAGADKAAP